MSSHICCSSDSRRSPPSAASTGSGLQRASSSAGLDGGSGVSSEVHAGPRDCARAGRRADRWPGAGRAAGRERSGHHPSSGLEAARGSPRRGGASRCRRHGHACQRAARGDVRLPARRATRPPGRVPHPCRALSRPQSQRGNAASTSYWTQSSRPCSTSGSASRPPSTFQPRQPACGLRKHSSTSTTPSARSATPCSPPATTLRRCSLRTATPGESIGLTWGALRPRTAVWLRFVEDIGDGPPRGGRSAQPVVEAWYLAPCESDPETADLIEDAIDLAEGPALERPLADRVRGSRYGHRRPAELRCAWGRTRTAHQQGVVTSRTRHAKRLAMPPAA